MKYPKPWEAGSPAGKPYVASSRQGPHEGAQPLERLFPLWHKRYLPPKCAWLNNLTR